MTVTGTRVKDGSKMQFWGTSQNPGKGPGMGFHVDCCPCECWVFEDDFNRASSTDVGSDWNEVSGDWEIIDDEELYEPGDDGAADIMCTVPAPAASAGEMHGWMTIKDHRVGDIYYLYLACTDSSATTGGVTIKYEKVGGEGQYGTWDVSINGSHTRRQVGAPHTCDDCVAKSRTCKFLGDGPCIRVWACTDAESGQTKAGIFTVGDEYAWADGVSASGRYFGLGHANTRGARFDDVRVTEIRTATQVCSNCFCWCLTKAVTRHLKATIVAATGRADCLEGVEWDMDWIWDAGVSRWVGTAEYPKYGSGYQEIDFNLWCGIEDDDAPSHPGKNFSLEWADALCCNANPGGCAATHIPLYTSTCEPFSLTFGPFEIRASDLTCLACYPVDPLGTLGTPSSGEYYIVITER